MNKAYQIMLIALFPLLLLGCGPKTKITSSWVNKEQSPTFKTVLIICLDAKETSRRLWENVFADQLSAENIKTVVSHEISVEPIPPDQDSVHRVVEAAKADTVIITHVIDSTTSTYWHPGTIHYEPSAFYGGMYGYYNTAFRAVYSPPTSTSQTIVRLESNMYDVDTTRLLWAAQSATTDPKLLRTDFESVVKTLIADFKRKKLI